MKSILMRRERTKTILELAARRRHYLSRRQARCSSNDAKNSGGPLVEQVKACAIGATAGLVGSLAGLGGGFVMIPMMTHHSRRLVCGLGLTQHQAHGTSLIAVGSTGLFGAIGYGIKTDAATEADDAEGNQGLVELESALAITATAMITARFGALFAARLSEKALQRALGAFMMFVAPLVPGKKYLLPEKKEHSKPVDDRASIDHLLPASMIGCFSGFLSGIFGVGGGAIVVPALVLSTDTTQHTAVATSLAAMVLPSMVGSYTHYSKGNVALRVAPLLALGSAAGSYFGGRYVGPELDEDAMKAGFSVLMLVLGAKTWKKGAS